MAPRHPQVLLQRIAGEPPGMLSKRGSKEIEQVAEGKESTLPPPLMASLARKSHDILRDFVAVILAEGTRAEMKSKSVQPSK